MRLLTNETNIRVMENGKPKWKRVGEFPIDRVLQALNGF